MGMDGLHYVGRLHTLREYCIQVGVKLQYVSIIFVSNCRHVGGMDYIVNMAKQIGSILEACQLHIWRCLRAFVEKGVR